MPIKVPAGQVFRLEEKAQKRPGHGEHGYEQPPDDTLEYTGLGLSGLFRIRWGYCVAYLLHNLR
jgi:hypothetical protein